MAQDDFQAFIERIKQAESRGQRYGKDGKLLTSPKGAQGEMQVMPATQRAPGFGVAPVRDSSPDEIARVGRDILRAFDTKYGGNRMYIAAAYNWGPGNADKWIAAGADFNKLPTETQKYLRKVAPETLTASRGRPAPATTTTTASEPAVMEPPLGISASSRGRTIAIGDSLAVGFAQANNLGGLHKGGAGPKAVLKMVQDYAANNSLEGVTVYLGTGLPNNPAQRDFVAKQVDLIKARGGNPVLFGAGPGSERTPTTGQNEFLQSVAQSTGAQFTGPLADRFPNISKQDRTGLHLTHPQYRQLFSQMGGTAPTASRPATAGAAASARPTAAASTAAATAAAPMAAAPAARAEDLGSGYKAALALSFLGSEDKDRPTTDSELEDRLNETALAEFNKELEDYTPKNALADMELTALNPAKFMQPVKMADGGEVDSEGMSFSKGNTPTGNSASPRFAAKELEAFIRAANPGATVLEYERGPGNALGFVHSKMPDVLNIKKSQTPGTKEQTILHELEHSLDSRGGDILGRPDIAGMDNNFRAYHLMNNDWRPIESFVSSVIQNKDKLRDFFGQDIISGYITMDPETFKKLKIRDKDRALFAEQIASLSALEQATGKSLTRDPEMRKIFPNTQMMAVYDALTGLRQTRTDARDLPPHTPLPSYMYETNPVTRFIRKKTTGPNEYGIPIKRAGGSPETGEVDNSENRGFFSRLFGGSNKDFIERTKSQAGQNEDYRSMLDYLQSRDAVPDVKTGYLPYGIDAAFSSMKLPLFGAVGSGSIKLNRDLAEAPEGFQIGPSTLTHEMAHAADRQFEQQAREQTGIFSKGNNFTDAYEKMVGSGGMREGKRRTDLARRYHPEWAAANRDYRSTPYEIAAHGVGKYAGPTSADDAPPHVDATAATEFQILLDLARRNSKEGNIGQMELDPANRPAFLTPKSGIGRRQGPISRFLNADAPVRRSNGSPEGGEVALTPEEIAEASRPATFNRNIARQGTAARNLAAMRDVNTLPDPRTYAAVSGFLGQAPDQMGFSVMHPDIQGIKRAGEVGFAASLVPVVAPVVAPVARAAGRAATALGMRAEKALDAPVTRTLEGGGRSADMLRALGSQPSFAVRPKGGHFELRPDKSGPGMAVWDDVKQTVSDSLANTKDQPLNNWFNTKYSAYLRRDLGTEGDPFVKAADAGKKLHIPNEPMSEGWKKTLSFVRKNEGLPPQGFATTEYGKRVEDSLDASLNIRELGDLAGSSYSRERIPPSIMQFANTNPEMRLYSLDEILEFGPRAGDLRDRMLFLRNTDEVRFYGEPPVKIPDTYKITNQALLGMSPVQASEKVAQFENWQQNIRQRAASSAIRKDPNVDKVDAGDGSLWVNTPDLGTDEKMRELVKDIGRDARWCTKDDKFCYAYGSGNSRLTILIDGKSRPVAQMTIDTIPPKAERFLMSLSPEELNSLVASNPLFKYAQDKKELAAMIETSPQFAEYLKRTPPSMAITEIKGWGNRENLVDLDAPMTAESLKKIQDRVKTLDAQYDLRFVENLSGIGLTEVPRNRPTAILDFFSLPAVDRLPLKNKFGSETEGFKAILDRAINMNGGSKYFPGNEDDISNIFQKATRDVLRNEAQSIMFNSFLPRAKGGMVERTYNDNRAYL